MFRALWSHSRNIDVVSNGFMLKYRIPTYFPMETMPLKLIVKQERDWITISAFNPKNNILPLLQNDVVLPTEAPELLYEPSGRNTSRGESEEAMAELLPEQQRSHSGKTETKVSSSDYDGLNDKCSNYPPGWVSTKCCD